MILDTMAGQMTPETTTTVVLLTGNFSICCSYLCSVHGLTCLFGCDCCSHIPDPVFREGFVRHVAQGGCGGCLWCTVILELKGHWGTTQGALQLTSDGTEGGPRTVVKTLTQMCRRLEGSMFDFDVLISPPPPL